MCVCVSMPACMHGYKCSKDAIESVLGPAWGDMEVVWGGIVSRSVVV